MPNFGFLKIRPFFVREPFLWKKLWKRTQNLEITNSWNGGPSNRCFPSQLQTSRDFGDIGGIVVLGWDFFIMTAQFLGIIRAFSRCWLIFFLIFIRTWTDDPISCCLGWNHQVGKFWRILKDAGKCLNKEYLSESELVNWGISGRDLRYRGQCLRYHGRLGKKWRSLVVDV